jgi:hypothetical protein
MDMCMNVITFIYVIIDEKCSRRFVYEKDKLKNVKILTYIKTDTITLVFFFLTIVNEQLRGYV